MEPTAERGREDQRFSSSRKTVTFRQWYTKNLLMLVLPLIALLLISSFYSISASNEKVAESNRRMVGYWAEQTESALTQMELFMSNVAYNEQEMSVLALKSSPEAATHALLMLLERFDAACLTFRELTSLFCSSSQNELFAGRFSSNNPLEYAQRESLRRFVRGIAESDGYVKKAWMPYLVDDRFYLMRFFERGDASVIAVVGLEDLTPRSLDDKATVVYQRLSDGALASGEEFILREGIELLQGQKPFYISGNRRQFMVIEQPFAQADFSMAFILSGSGFWDGLDGVQILLLALSALSIVLVSFMHVFANRWLNEPISQLTGIMERIRCGELKAQIDTHFPMKEFAQVRDTFNDMMSQIHTLKIDAYERELDRQHVELQYLHLQIRPHFFLNCLKSLYACAQQNKTSQMQEMILSISNHIRYWFRNTLTTVTLSDEVGFAVNYIKIQQLCLAPAPTYELQIDETLNDFHIPPFTVQTFVENAIHHEWRAGQPLHIVIKATRLRNEEQDFASISVSDNGDGFPEEMLATLNNPATERYAQRHIGLNNIKQRIYLIYGERAVVAFYNNLGSHAEMILPIAPEEGEEP